MATPGPVDWTDEAIAQLAVAEAEVEQLSAQIRAILTDLTKNATNRVKTLFEISQHRIEREDLIEHLYAGTRLPPSCLVTRVRPWPDRWADQLSVRCSPRAQPRAAG